MPKIRSARRLLARSTAVALTALVAACGLEPWDGGFAGVNAVPEEEGRGVFRIDDFEEAPVRRIEFRDPYQREELVFFQGRSGARAEFVYATTLELGGEFSVLEYKKLVREMLPEWTFNKGNIALAESSKLTSGTQLPGAFHRYRHTGENRDCVGYVLGWDPDRFDRFFRNDRYLFGYYCAAPGEKLTDEKANELVGAIGVKGITEPGRFDSNFTKQGPGSHSDAQLQLARFGTAEEPAGNTGFPFVLQKIFSIRGGKGS